MSSDLAFVPYGGGDFLKVVEDGIEYYTEVATGASGMSYRGLGRFIGKDHKSITYWVRKINGSELENNSLPECLKSFIGKPLVLGSRSEAGGAEILSDVFCAAMVAYYAMFAAPLDQTREARFALFSMGGVGMRSFIQSKTKWQTEAHLQVDSVADRIRLRELDVRLAEIELERRKLELSAPKETPAVLPPTPAPAIPAVAIAPVNNRPKRTPSIGAKSGGKKRSRQVEPSITPVSKNTEDLVLRSLAGGKKLTAFDIAVELSFGTGYIRRSLAWLYRHGKVDRSRFNDHYDTPYIYHLPG